MFQDEIRESNMHFLAVLFEMRNSSLIILSEGEDQLGTLAVAIPPTQGLVGGATTPLSSVLLGDRNIMIARMIAERLSVKTQKIALVSVSLRTVTENEAGPALLRLADRIMETSLKASTTTAEQASPSQQPQSEPPLPPELASRVKDLAGEEPASATEKRKEGAAA